MWGGGGGRVSTLPVSERRRLMRSASRPSSTRATKLRGRVQGVNAMCQTPGSRNQGTRGAHGWLQPCEPVYFTPPCPPTPSPLAADRRLHALRAVLVHHCLKGPTDEAQARLLQAGAVGEVRLRQRDPLAQQPCWQGWWECNGKGGVECPRTPTERANSSSTSTFAGLIRRRVALKQMAWREGTAMHCASGPWWQLGPPSQLWRLGACLT